MRDTFYLLIDDDSIVNNMHSLLFRMMGINDNVYIFENAEQALDFIFYSSERGNFSYLIFLDLNMPMMNGWEFLNELENEDKEILKKVKVFIVTSSIDNNDKERATHHPIVSEYISKPLKKEHLHEIQNKYGRKNFEVN